MAVILMPVFWVILITGGIIPLVLILPVWRKIVNPVIELFYDLIYWRRRKTYLPPKIEIEGLGAQRSLSLPEVLVLYQVPLDQVLGIILYEVVRKNTVRILSKEPPRFDVESLLPKDMPRYQKELCRALDEKTEAIRQKKLTELIEKLIKTAIARMQGYSSKETLAFYQQQIDTIYQDPLFVECVGLVADVMKDEESFTTTVVSLTNPLPAVPIFKEIPRYLRVRNLHNLIHGPGSYRGGGGGGGCACAGCACAGCACACAGGGR